MIVPYHEKCGNIFPGIENITRFLSEKPFKSEVLVVSGKSAMFEDLPEDLLSEVPLVLTDIPKDARKNQGSAYVAGFRKARGDWAMLVDSDMLFLESELDKVISAMAPSRDIVRTYRSDFARESALRKAGSETINFIFNLGSGARLRDVGSSLSAYTRNIYHNVFNDRFKNYHVFLPFVVSILAAEQNLFIKEIPVKIPPVPGERSSYSISQLLRVGSSVINLKIISLISRIFRASKSVRS